MLAFSPGPYQVGGVPDGDRLSHLSLNQMGGDATVLAFSSEPYQVSGDSLGRFSHLSLIK